LILPSIFGSLPMLPQTRSALGYVPHFPFEERGLSAPNTRCLLGHQQLTMLFSAPLPSGVFPPLGIVARTVVRIA